jgi:hypothetical protein
MRARSLVVSIVLIAATLAASALPSATARAARPFNGCGSLKAFYHERGTRQYVRTSAIRATGLRCGFARHVARRWAHHSRLSGDPARHAAGFTCRYKRRGSDIGIGFCHKGKQHRVRFHAYDSSPFH